METDIGSIERLRDAQRKLRSIGQEERRKLSPGQREQKDQRIRERLLENPRFEAAQDILCYVSYGAETDTLGLIQRALVLGKRVFCPRVSGKGMVFCRIGSLKELRPGFRSIPEPKEGAKPWLNSGAALAIVPGCAFDRAGHRIGYGGGYYDRYFGAIPEERRPYLAGLCYACQLVEQIVPLPHDIPMDLILTEEETGGFL